ncbi:AraC family transcriptional regulator [Roseomonas hellenica]|nr:AraC family transcriptional regulator [Plastoroseomonas hellenica]MBR0643890.1 AraC family transcriptional regulator [Plastoroseomonas hellenica]
MGTDLTPRAFQGLGRSCETPGGGSIVPAPPSPGIERIEARFFGDAFTPHRHDTYALGVTLDGVQRFRYRGEERHSLPGQVIALHPDELHDGGAGTEDGLRYRMLYLEPSLLLRALGDQAPLPFVRQPVLTDPSLRAALLAALTPLEEGLDEILVADVVAAVARGLARHAGRPLKPSGRLAPRQVLLARRQVLLARDHLAAHATRAVGAAELEGVTGLDRYALSRHFRALLGTSPHRFLLMRRLQRARGMIRAGESLADIAAATGFADQSHLNRHFKKAFGLTPGRWAALLGAGRPCA